MNTRYRLVPNVLGIKRLQFKSEVRFLFWEFDVWRYVPGHYSERCFERRDCPIFNEMGSIWFGNDRDAFLWVEKYPDVDKWLRILYLQYLENKEIVYLDV